jgi:hypothetical protein
MRFATFVIIGLLAGTTFAAAAPWPTAGWRSSTPEEQRMSSGAFADTVDTVGPLGLDGRFRLAASNRFGIAAARGPWVGDSRLEIERRILGASATQRWQLTFEGDDVEVHFVDTDGDKADIHGHVD